MMINGKDAMHLKKYDYKGLQKIYQQGTDSALCDKESLSETETAFIASAGHAMDLADILGADKKRKLKLDFTFNTENNIGNAVVLMMLHNIQSGISEHEARRNIAVKLSSYLMFDMWNSLQMGAKENYTEFDVKMRGTMISKQGIWLISRDNITDKSFFNTFQIGHEFAENDIHFTDPKNCMVDVDMQAFFLRIQNMLKKMLSNGV